ncbi:hypothetical protein LSTR_LSTR012087 [Laodelphax striatellus]|uniref:Beta-glucuronidase n=1 Tax=Laodelphax striatellus TaxID=195883 RepID=A0A482WKB1_LAOST|nr:hypothetical protein LSTR_LSTR012087 [Laodelphax striatellus]
MICKIFVFALFCLVEFSNSCLFPYESETRQTKSLNGLWSFKVINGSSLTPLLEESDKDVIKMPVPSSFNDITTNPAVRDHFGLVVYQTKFFVPMSWKDGRTRVFIHFGGVHYLSHVFLNGIKVGTNKGGHLPFEIELSANLKVGANILTVNVDNILTPDSLPQGKTTNEKTDWSAKNVTTYSHNCDYFDYAGINRPVTLFTTPTIRICDVEIKTTYKDGRGFIQYSIDDCEDKPNSCEVRLYDKNNEFVTSESGPSSLGTMVITDVHLWWPIMSKHSPGYLYTMEMNLFGHDNSTVDVYRQPVGIRKISWNSNSLFINNEEIYLRGVGMHEDSDLRGRGFDNVILARDMNLMKWLGANSFRPSHYPYAEETLNEADSMGILVIMETPACSLDQFGDKIRQEHDRILKQMIKQHKHRPSVVMWSLANEPQTDKNNSGEYFSHLFQVAHSYDKTRPVTFVTSQGCKNDKAVKYMDVVCFNRYKAWYERPGRLEFIKDMIKHEIQLWHETYSKPVILTEYGAGSLSGYHSLPSTMWTEDYQVNLHEEHFKAFDELRGKGLSGEMVWNFIDFQVPQEYNRPGRCSKGLFTRERQPKAVAHVIRNRYHLLAEESPKTYSCKTL